MSKILTLTEENHNAIIEQQLLAEGILNDILNGIANFISRLFSKENIDKAKQLGQQGTEWAKEKIQNLVDKAVEEYLPALAQGALKLVIEQMAKKKIPFTEANLKIALRDNIKILVKKAAKAVGLASLVFGGVSIAKILTSTVAGEAAGKNKTLIILYNEMVMAAVNKKVYPYILQEAMTFEEMKAVYEGPDDISLPEPLEPQELNETKTYQRWQKIAGIIKG